MGDMNIMNMNAQRRLGARRSFLSFMNEHPPAGLRLNPSMTPTQYALDAPALKMKHEA
jgi:hypothetical protein